MDRGREPSPRRPLRHHFTGELEQIRLQVELMALRVADALRGAHDVLESGSAERAAQVVAADDEIDDMFVSLTERCYDVIRRESPVASDLRLVVSVIRILEEFERIGDLALRVVKVYDDQKLLESYPVILETLLQMCRVAEESFAIAVDAWSTGDCDRAAALIARERVMDQHLTRLTTRLLALAGPDATHVAITAVLVGRSLERISDHAVVIGERLRYLLTGDSTYLAAEVR
ncbi:MAG: phosphate signaling complex protein PhoU [Actinomycetota bacterium]